MTRKVRVPDLQVVFQPDTSFLVKSMTRGVGARVPMQAIGVLALCGVPRTADEVAQALGDPVGACSKVSSAPASSSIPTRPPTPRCSSTTSRPSTSTAR